MTDKPEQVDDDGSVLNLDTLEYYLVLGVKKDTHEPVFVASPQISLSDLGAMLGRAQAQMQLQVVQAGVYAFTKATAHQEGRGKVIVPSSRLKS